MRYVVELINEYDPGPFPEDFEREVIQLASNENPYPPHEEVLKAIKNSILRINRYPSPYYLKLKEKLSEYLGVEVDNIAVSNGASDLIRVVTDAIIEPFDRVFVPMPSFTLYILFSMLREGQIITKVFEGYRIDGCYDKGKIAFLCSPNNPTGNTIEEKVVEEYLQSFDYVVLDEAYVEFSENSLIGLLDHYENLIILRTFSKFFGLAGMRLGYAVAHERIVKAIEKIRNPFSISILAYTAGVKALENVDYYKKVAELIKKERERLFRELRKKFFVYDSEANFLLVKHGYENLPARLMERGILVRDVTGLEGLEGYHFRVTIGRREENDEFLRAVDELC